MQSETDICNAALIAVGQPQITSLDQASTAGRLCARLYPAARDALLRTFDWNWAREQANLAALDETPAHTWTYAYQLPSDCLALRGVEQDTTDRDYNARWLPWEIQGRKVLTHLGAPLGIVYTAARTDTGAMDPAYTAVLSLRIGRDLAMPLAQSASLRAELNGDYLRELRQARGTSFRENQRVMSENWLARAMIDW